MSGRDLVLLIGGLFLVAKSTHEIHEKIEGAEEDEMKARAVRSMAGVLVQITLLDIVFSLDSVITAVGHGQGRARDDRGHRCRGARDDGLCPGRR